MCLPEYNQLTVGHGCIAYQAGVPQYGNMSVYICRICVTNDLKRVRKRTQRYGDKWDKTDSEMSQTKGEHKFSVRE